MATPDMAPPNRPLRVLHVIDHMSTGGAQENVCEIIEALPAQRFSFDVATLFGPNRYRDRLADLGAGCIDLQTTDNYSSLAALSPRLTHRLRRLLRERRYDIVQAHLYVAPLQLAGARRWRRTPAQPVIVSLHAERSTLPAHIWAAFRVARPIVDRWVVPDQDVTPRDLVAIGIDPDRIEFVPYCVKPVERLVDAASCADLRRSLQLEPQHIVLLSAARLHPQRCIETFVEAVAELRRRNPDNAGRLRLLLAGDGPQEPALRALADRLGVADQVRFLGRREDVPHLLSISDIYLTMSVRGAVGVGGMQALTVKLPTVAQEVDGGPRALDQLAPGEPCVTVTSAAAMAEEVAALAADPERRRRLGTHGATYIELHRSIAAMAGAWERCYSELAAAGDPA